MDVLLKRREGILIKYSLQDPFLRFWVSDDVLHHILQELSLCIKLFLSVIVKMAPSCSLRGVIWV